jgi:hypothetical protein
MSTELSISEKIKAHRKLPGLSKKERLKYKEELKALAAEHVPEAVKTLANLARSHKTPASARVASCSAILDRFAGRPAKPEDKLSPEHELDKLSASELVQVICDQIAHFPVQVRATIAQALIAADNGHGIEVDDFLEEDFSEANSVAPAPQEKPKREKKIPRR